MILIKAGATSTPPPAGIVVHHLQANVYGSQSSGSLSINLATDGGAPGLVGANQQLIIGVTSAVASSTGAISSAGSASLALIVSTNVGSCWQKFYRITGLSQTTLTFTASSSPNHQGGLQAWSVLNADQSSYAAHSSGGQTGNNTFTTGLSVPYSDGDVILAHTRIYDGFSVPLSVVDLLVTKVIDSQHQVMSGAGSWTSTATVSSSGALKIAQALVLAEAA